MMKKALLFFMFATTFWAFTACKHEEPRENRGRIVGIFRCPDTEYKNILQGYFIEINGSNEIHYQNAILSFNIDVKDSLKVSDVGRIVISPIDIPYDFTYRIVESGDEGYVSWGDFAESAIHWTPFEVEKQVLIYPKNN